MLRNPELSYCGSDLRGSDLWLFLISGFIKYLRTKSTEHTKHTKTVIPKLSGSTFKVQGSKVITA